MFPQIIFREHFFIDLYRYPIYNGVEDIAGVDISRDDIQGVLGMASDINRVLTQPMYYILLSLKKKRHGYEIMQYVEWLTKERVKIGPGTLYSLLARFEEAGYIQMVSTEDNRKKYLITPLGEAVLNGEIKRLQSLIGDAEIVLGGNEDEFQNRE